MGSCVLLLASTLAASIAAAAAAVIAVAVSDATAAAIPWLSAGVGRGTERPSSVLGPSCRVNSVTLNQLFDAAVKLCI